MKRRLLFIFGMIACWASSYAQVPEYLYYKFDDSTTIVNYASNPQGNQNIPVPSDLIIDTAGFQDSYALSKTLNSGSGEGIETGFQPDYSRSFTISFWYHNDSIPPSGSLGFYLFGDSAAGYHVGGQVDNFGITGIFAYGKGGLEANMGGNMIPQQSFITHIVYDATPTETGSYGTYTLYVNGVSLLGDAPVLSAPANQSSGIVIGGTAGPGSIFSGGNMLGRMDEFRWYNRALTLTEINNTIGSDIVNMGSCAPYTRFQIDSISGEAAKISWTPGAGNDSFFLEYDTAGFTPGTGTKITGSYPSSQIPLILSALSPETEYDVYFGEYCNGGSDSVYNLQPQTFRTTPLCPTPIYVDFLTVGRDSIEITWDHTGPEQEFYVTYGHKDFDTTTSGITDTMTSIPFVIKDLDPETVYDFYVHTHCGSSYGKSIVVKRSMMTDCGVKTAPFFEDFDGSTWISGKGRSPAFPLGAGDTINSCWSRNGGGFGNEDYAWEVMSGDLGGRGENQFLGTGGMTKGNIRHHQYYVDAIIYSPFIDISSLNSPYLSFNYYRQFGLFFHQAFNYHNSIQPDLHVEINDGSGWHTLKMISGYEQMNESVRTITISGRFANLVYPAPDPFKKMGIDISGYDDTVQIRFRAVNLADNGTAPGIMAIDDFSIAEAPQCPDIFDAELAIINSDTTVVIDIESSATSYALEWGPRGFEQGTGCTQTLSEPFILDSCILVNQEMDLYIQNCDNSLWQGPYPFCGPRTAPYVEDFDDIKYTSADYWVTMRNAPCWDMYASGKQSSGDFIKITPQAHDWNHHGDNYRNSSLAFYNYTVTPNDTLIGVTPAFIDLPDGDKQLRFKAMAAEGVSSTPYIVIGTMGDPKKGNTFIAIDTINLKYNQWKDYVFKLDETSGYNGTDLHIALKSGEGIKRCLIDDFHYEEIPSCPIPLSTSIEVEDIWMDAATIYWGLTPNPTVVRYGPEGGDPEGTSFYEAVALTDTIYRISGLDPATTYDVYIRDSCGLDDNSRWIGPLTFATLCTPFPTPYYESFDGPSWIPAPGIHPYDPSVANYDNLLDTLDNCWRRNSDPGIKKFYSDVDSLEGPSHEKIHTWGVTQNYANGYESTPFSDRSGNGNYVVSLIRRSVTSTGKEEGIGDFYSPLINLSSLNHPYLTFYYHRMGVERMPDFWVEVNDGNGWDTVKYFSGPEATQTTRLASAFYQAGVSLLDFSDTVQIRFRSLHQYESPRHPSGLTALDDIEIKEAPPCVKPEELTENHFVNASTASWRSVLRWEASASLVEGYEVLVGAPGFDPDSLAALGAGIYVEGTDSLVLDTLRAGECYEFVVRSICSTGDTSEFSNRDIFCLPCSQIAPITENFDLFPEVEIFNTDDLASENGKKYHPCWYYQSISKRLAGDIYNYDYFWRTGTDIGNPGIGVGASTDADSCIAGQFLYTHGGGPITNGDDSTVFYSPLIDVRGLTAPELSFAYYMFGTSIRALHADVYDGLNWHNVVSLIGPQQSIIQKAWKDTAVDISSYNATGFVQIRFRAKRDGGSGGSQIAIDNFRVSDPVNCPAPTCFHVSNVTDSTATLAWQPPVDVNDFEVEYGFRGYNYGEGTKVTTALDSVVVPVGENRLYDAYIRSVCGNGDSSFVVGPVPFESLPVLCHEEFEAYTPGALNGQSALFKSWVPPNEDVPGVGFYFRGDEEISDLDANNGSQSLRLYEGPEGGASAVALLNPPIGSDFDEMTRNVFTIDFSFSVNDTGGGYYDILSTVREDYEDRRYYNAGFLGFRFNQSVQMWQAFNRNDPSVVLHSFRYNAGWNDLRHVVDIDNDSVWMVLNGMDMQTGWKYTVGNGGTIATWGPGGPPIKQFEGVHFLTTPENLNYTTSASEFFIDDFCISPYECPEPSDLVVGENSCTYAEVSWLQGVKGAKTIIEYGTSGFVKGSGDTFITRVGKHNFEDLTPGKSYDVYISEVCGFDTVFTGPVSFTLPTEATADFTYTMGNPTYNNLEVTFDASGSVGANAYVWDFGDFKAGSGETTSHVYIRNRTYTVSLIVESDCGNDTITKTIDISGIGLEENILSQSLEVYPNPFTDKVQIRFETYSSEDVVIRVSDLSGKQILRESLTSLNGRYEGELDLGHLAKGSYMIRIESGEMEVTRRIVKQ